MANSEIINILKQSPYFPKVKSCMTAHKFLGPNINVLDFFTQILDDYDQFKQHYTGSKVRYETVKGKMNALISVCNVDEMKEILGDKHPQVIDAYQKFKKDMKSEIESRPTVTYKTSTAQNESNETCEIINNDFVDESIHQAETRGQVQSSCEEEQIITENENKKKNEIENETLSHSILQKQMNGSPSRHSHHEPIKTTPLNHSSIHHPPSCSSYNSEQMHELYNLCILTQRENALLKETMHTKNKQILDIIKAFRHVEDNTSIAILNVFETIIKSQ